MSKGYYARGKYYSVDQRFVQSPCMALRANKNAAGITYTALRKGSSQAGRTKDALLPLMLYGTFDPLARTNRMKRFRHENYQQIQRWVRK